MTDSSSILLDPVLSVPEVVFPENHLDHRAVIEEVFKQYDPLLELNPGDPEYQRGFVQPIKVAKRMAGALAIDAHPLHLPLEEIIRPRGWRVRNAQALDAFRSYAPRAAKQAVASAAVSAGDIDAVVVETSTVVAMPNLAYEIIDALGLRPDTHVIPITFMGCTGGGDAIVRARDYLLAYPDRTVLIVVADFASPHFHVEQDLRGTDLRGSAISATLFSDGAAAAVMSRRPTTPGFQIVNTRSVRVPGTQSALSWEVADDGLRFRLTDQAVKLIPQVTPTLQALLAEQGWKPDELAICSFHAGGNRIIDNVQSGLGLTEHQVRPGRESLRHGNTMSVAVFEALRVIADEPALRPAHQGRGIGAGFGPGFNCASFAWTFHDPLAAVASAA
jgi:predicted naringenin-chalcone synthase